MIYAIPSRSGHCSTGITPVLISAARLPRLSTYLGHVYPKDTYWYLQAVPELLELAARNIDQLIGGELDDAARARPCRRSSPTG